VCGVVALATKHVECRRYEIARMPKLEVVFARPPFEHQLIFGTEPITVFPKFLCVLKVVRDLVKAAKYADEPKNECPKNT
jgi:hypothetical protein